MPNLWKNSFVTVSQPVGTNLVVMRRSSSEIDDIAEVEQVADRLAQLFPLDRRRDLVLLQDMRDAPRTTDAEYERKMVPIVMRMCDGFSRIAVLIRTAVGQLQARRLQRSGALPYGVFDDEDEALRFLSQGGNPRGREQ